MWGLRHISRKSAPLLGKEGTEKTMNSTTIGTEKTMENKGIIGIM